MNNLQSRNPVDQSKGYYEILSESVNKIKNSLNNMREIRVPEEDPLVYILFMLKRVFFVSQDKS